MHQIHAALKAKLEGHIEAAGHTILPHDDNNVIFDRTKYAHLVGETGSAYYMRRRFPVDTTPNWGFHNEHIMEAFFDKATLRNQGIIMALKCSSEWVHPDARNTTWLLTEAVAFLCNTTHKHHSKQNQTKITSYFTTDKPCTPIQLWHIQ